MIFVVCACLIIVLEVIVLFNTKSIASHIVNGKNAEKRKK